MKIFEKIKNLLQHDVHPASRAFLLLTRFWSTPKTLHESSEIFLEHALHVARIQIRTQA